MNQRRFVDELEDIFEELPSVGEMQEGVDYDAMEDL